MTNEFKEFFNGIINNGISISRISKTVNITKVSRTIDCLMHAKELKRLDEIQRIRNIITLWWKNASETSPWYSMPKGSELLIDTCVWMKLREDYRFRVWLDFVVSNAQAYKWKIVVPYEVSAELERLKSDNDNGERARLARYGYKLMMDVQVKLLEIGLFESHAKSARDESAFADPVFSRYLNENKNSILFTLDNHLTFVVRQDVKNIKRVCSEDNLEFPPFIEMGPFFYGTEYPLFEYSSQSEAYTTLMYDGRYAPVESNAKYCYKGKALQIY